MWWKKQNKTKTKGHLGRENGKGLLGKRMLRRFGMEKEREYFIENLAMMLGAGISMSVVLDYLKRDAGTKRMKHIIQEMREGIASGKPLWEVCETSGLFDENTISLLRSGEESGRLSENVELIRKQESRSRVFASRMQSAMLYPGIIFFVMTVIGLGIAWFILPKLAKTFEGLHVELPPLTRGLIALGEFIAHYGYIVIPSVIVFIAILFFFLFFFPPTRFIGQWILLSLPGIRRLIREVELARMGYTMGSLIQSGIPIISALDSLSHSTILRSYQVFYQSLRDGVENGFSFEELFIRNPRCRRFLPLPVQSMILAGEKTGNLDTIFLHIGENFELKNETTAKNISVLLEPFLLFVVWIGVVLLALAVIMPIYGLIGGLSGAPSSVRPKISPPVSESTIESQEVTEQEIIAEQEEIPDEEVAMEMRQVIITGVYVNVRDQASLEGELMGRIYRDEVYEMLSSENGWFKVVFSDDGSSGWISSEYAQIKESDETDIIEDEV